jgi:BASS family bile acid:Na+ symporter
MENAFSNIFLPSTLAVITFAMGLSIEFKDFKSLFRYPKAVIVGLICQMVLLPIIAFGIVIPANIDPAYKVGLIIIASCPGGATSNLVTFMLAGNVALSISITVINSLITLITIPLIVGIALFNFMGQHSEISLPVFNTILNIFFITIIPASAGVFTRRYIKTFADNLQKPLQYALPILLLLVFLGVVFLDEGEEAKSVLDYLFLVPYVLLLNVLSMFTGWLIAKLTRLGRKNQFTISVEVGLQNSALAIFIASTLLENNAMAVVAVIYGSFSFLTTLFTGWFIKRLSR